MANESFKLTAPKAILHSLVGLGIFLSAQVLSGLLFLMNMPIAATILSSALSISLLFFGLSQYCRKNLSVPLSDCRVRKASNWLLWIICAIALPCAVSCFFVLATPGIFAAAELTGAQKTSQIITAVFSMCLSAGICEELLFRGFMMKMIEARWGKIVAVIAPSLLFGIVHIINIDSPNLSDIAMLIIAGTSVGIMFSVIAYRSGSIWPGALVHSLWNLIIIGGIFEIGVSINETSLFTYQLTSRSIWLYRRRLRNRIVSPGNLGLLACHWHPSFRNYKSKARLI